MRDQEGFRCSHTRFPNCPMTRALSSRIKARVCSSCIMINTTRLMLAAPMAGSQRPAESGLAALHQLQKNLAFHLSGHVLHSLFWRNMTSHGGGEPSGELADAIKESFGSFAGM